MKDQFLRNFRIILFLVIALFPTLALVARAQDQAFVCFDAEAMIEVVETQFLAAEKMAFEGRCMWVVIYIPTPGTLIETINDFSVWMIPTQTEIGIVEIFYFTKHKPPSIVFDGAKS